jgi:hypothetical protein
MHVGCLGRPLRPPRWPSRRTKWRNLIRATELSAVLIAVLIAGELGVEHLHRSPSDADTNGPSMGAVVGSPAADSTSPEGTSQRSTEVDDHPRSTNIAPSALVHPSAQPKRPHARLRSTAATHRQIMAARATPLNGNVHCGLHSLVRDSGCHQEGAGRPPGVTPAVVLRTTPVLPSDPAVVAPNRRREVQHTVYVVYVGRSLRRHKESRCSGTDGVQRSDSP